MRNVNSSARCWRRAHEQSPLRGCPRGITYDPNLDATEIERLRALSKPGEKVLISSVPDQPAPIIATAWANQLELTTTGDTRLKQSVNEFECSPDAPEPGGNCVGGIGTSLG